MRLKVSLDRAVRFIKNQRAGFLALVIFNIAFLVQGSFLSRCIVLSFIFFMPGLALIGGLRKDIRGFWEKTILSLALSLLYLMTLGLVIDFALPTLFHVAHPLSTGYIFPALDISYLMILAVNRKTEWGMPVLHRPRLSANKWLSAPLWIIASFIFITSICGALILNNGGSNLVALCAQIAALTLLIFLFIAHKKLSPSGYPYIIFLVALGLLYSFSLRGGSHILGWDINQEYRTYLGTALPGHWVPGGLNHDAYNACLSLTILPTIIHCLTRIGGETIFKLAYPFFFALVPVAVFLIASKFIRPFLALLASVLFVSQSGFDTELPALARQETALLFIAALILVILSSQIRLKTRKTLLFCLIIGCTLSHYSTAYTLLIVLVLAYIFERVLDSFFNKRDRNIPSAKTVLSGLMLCVAVLLVFLWNLQVTQSGQGVTSTLSQSVLNLDSIFGNNSRSDAASRAIGFSQPPVTQADVNKYVQQNSKTNTQLYEDANQFEPTFLPPETSSPKNVAAPITDEANTIFKLTGIVVKISLLIGLLLLLYEYRRSRNKEQAKMICLLSFAAVSGLLIFAVAPDFSIAYGIGRLYVQTLIILAIPLIMGMEWLAKKLGRFEALAICVLIFLNFSLTLGLRSQLFGGTPAVSLNNSGDKYNFYIHDGEVESAQWLNNQDKDNEAIYADIYSYLKFESLTPINLKTINTTVLPTTIDKSSYVYARQINLQGTGALRDYNFFHQATVDYTYPLDFLNSNKDTVYSNQDSKVYK